MTTLTARFKLPLLAPGQAQKELFHNEAVAALDALLNASVEAVGSNAPPAAPQIGQSWILGAAPTGAWAGQPHAIAWWGDGGWRFAAPAAGMRATIRDSGLPVAWEADGWRVGEVRAGRVAVGGVQVVGPRQPAIAEPAGGAVIDAEARAAVAAILASLRAHGLLA